MRKKEPGITRGEKNEGRTDGGEQGEGGEEGHLIQRTIVGFNAWHYPSTFIGLLLLLLALLNKET